MFTARFLFVFIGLLYDRVKLIKIKVPLLIMCIFLVILKLYCRVASIQFVSCKVLHLTLLLPKGLAFHFYAQHLHSSNSSSTVDV